MPYADMLTLDQIRVLQAIVDTGTFSGAAHQLGRSQGAISYQVAAMENTLELQLFDRSNRRPKLTAAGRAIATEAPRLLARIDRLRGIAKGLRDGLEPRLSIAVDALFPMANLTPVLLAFREQFPNTPLELSCGVRSAIRHEVRAGKADVGIQGDPTDLPAEVVSPRVLTTVTLVPVVACGHPLAEHAGTPIAAELLAAHVHVVLREPGASELLSIASPGDPANVWRVSDQRAQVELIRAGLGWSRIPLRRVSAALQSQQLVELDLSPYPSRFLVPLGVIHRRDRPPGPATRWLLDQLDFGTSSA